ncbi:hypothetical protein QEN19_003741 [Hanseniaspora menglaensis]
MQNLLQSLRKTPIKTSHIFIRNGILGIRSFHISSKKFSESSNEKDKKASNEDLKNKNNLLYTNNYMTSNQSGLYGAAEIMNEDLFSNNIPTVDLSYEEVLYEGKHNYIDSPIIILHGLFGSRTSNRSMSKHLVNMLKRDIYLLDLRNHGASPHISRHDYPSMAADVERWIKKLKFEDRRPIIIGHSMGAKVAMASTLRNPSLYSSLCSIDNVPVATFPLTSFPRYVTQLLKIVNNPDISSQKQCIEILQPIEKRLSVQQFLLTTLSKYKDNKTGKYRYKSKIPLDILKDVLVKGNISNWEYNSLSHRCNIPSLFIKGSKSEYMSDEYVSEIGKFFPHFELKEVEGSHWVNSEKPEDCANVIAEFIERFEDK